MQLRAQDEKILGANDVMKGYKVYLHENNFVVMTPHVAPIDKLT